uniref:Uncharacterized protein n=1 Tax=Heterorhabditis bacteriophora TaxID=37862 RepID=A0A1I7WJ57_HETBA
MRFSSDFTTDILCDCLQFNSKFAEKNNDLFNIGIVISVAKETITLDDFAKTRLGLCRYVLTLVRFNIFHVHIYSFNHSKL